jgi:uncharacterized protein (DUF2336 family)
MMFPALIHELDNAVASGTPARRAEILARITDIFVAGSNSYSANQIELFDDVFVRVATVIEQAARAKLANRLARMPRAPSMISHVLASDDEIDVAGPVLEQSERLSNEILVATARTKSQRHLLAISRRTSLAEAVTDVLVERGDKPVVLSTVSNPAARFSDGGYATLVKRSHGDDELATCVALRADIPRDHLLRLLVRASHDVQLKLEATHPAMANMIQSAVAEAANAILDTSTTLSRDYTEARAHVDALQAAGQLGENHVAAFATADQFEETAAALALLCGLPIEAVDRALVQEQPDAVLVMGKAIGLSWPTTKAILRMRAGARGISPGELEECQNTFARLKPAIARQVIEFQVKRPQGLRFGQSAA